MIDNLITQRLEDHNTDLFAGINAKISKLETKVKEQELTIQRIMEIITNPHYTPSQAKALAIDTYVGYMLTVKEVSNEAK